MASKKPKSVLYRRKRERKTNYRKRLKLLISGKPRLVLRFTNRHVIAQVVEFTTDGDRVIIGLNSSTLKKLGWPYSCRNMPAIYLTGLLMAKEAQQKGCKEAILDTGYTSVLKKGKVYAFLKGVLEGGFYVSNSGEKEIFPNETMLRGEHIKLYAQKLKEENLKLYEQKFTKYLKKGALPEKIEEKLNQIRGALSSKK